MTAAQFVNHVEISADWVRRRDQDKFFKKVRGLAGDMVPELARRFNLVKNTPVTRRNEETGEDEEVPAWERLTNANAELTQFNEQSDRLRKSVDSQILRGRDFWRKDLDLTATDDDINAFCDAKARQCHRLIIDFTGVCLSESIFKVIESYGVTLSSGERKKIYQLEKPMLERLQDEKWWRRKIKKLAFRTCEQIMRELGHTSARRGSYVSDYTLRRFISSERRNANLLDALEATNELGETFTLSELSAVNVSNHEIRRGELMTRLRGQEEWAAQDSREWDAMFYTITCPSKYHIYSGSVKNEKYNGSTPKQAQSYLSSLWAKVRSKIGRDGIECFGVRVAEPHHDGCPHWHVLLFVERHSRDALTGILREYALREDGREPGALEHRFQAEFIDPRKGSAVGYVAKYVSKNIDGFAVGIDLEAERYAIDTAVRVRAWASCWGIKQFQEIGAPPVTVYRELRRLARNPERIPVEGSTSGTPEQLSLILNAADTGDYCEYVNQMGGMCVPRCARPMSICRLVRQQLSKYSETIHYIAGLWCHWFVFPLRTRVHEWTVKLKQVAPPKSVAGARDLFLSGATAPPLDLCQ